MKQENQNIEHKRIWKDEYLRSGQRVADANGAKDDAKNGAKDDAKNITERQSKILDLISQNPHISLDAIAEAIGVSSPTIDREIAKMTNIVKRVGPKNGATGR